jgi:melibiose permease/lactose/raffinose/galactose permease
VKNLEKRNRINFGLGTIGRDMFYAFEANALLYFLTHILSLPEWVFGAAVLVLTVMRIFDAFNDPITGLLIDNIRSPWGKFKPAILIGGVLSAIFAILLFSGIGSGWGFIILFAASYILWDISFGINDIGYWTLLPVLSTDQRQREKTGAFARICASIGAYAVMVTWMPVTQGLGNTPKVWLICISVLSGIYLLGLLFPLLGVKEQRTDPEQFESTTVKQMFRAILKNDQLLWTTLSMGLFMVGYTTTITFAPDYMKYVFGNEGLYMVLAAVVGVAQMSALIVYPHIAKLLKRRQLYTVSIGMMLIGYCVFFFANQSLVLVIIGALLVFVGQAFIQALMLMFLTDTIEYGYWKLGKKNESITFSIQPFINKIGGALATGIVGLAVILAGIKVGDTSAVAIDAQGQLMVKVTMFLIPMVLIVLGYVIYMWKFKIDEQFYAQILKDLEQREQAQTKQ